MNSETFSETQEKLKHDKNAPQNRTCKGGLKSINAQGCLVPWHQAPSSFNS